LSRKKEWFIDGQIPTGNGRQMNKNYTISVRLTQPEVDQLGDLTRGQLTRSQIIQILIRDFLDRTREEQQKFLVDKLFGASRFR
jgi:hypothetical protein